VAALVLPENGRSYAALGFVAAGYAVTAAGYAAVTLRRPALASSEQPAQ
jgi:hypothetical protein